MVVADILIAGAALGFLLADVKQAHKLWKFKHYDTNAISVTHWNVKILSLVTVITGYAILSLHFAITVASLQLALSLYVMKRVKWGKHK